MDLAWFLNELYLASKNKKNSSVASVYKDAEEIVNFIAEKKRNQFSLLLLQQILSTGLDDMPLTELKDLPLEWSEVELRRNIDGTKDITYVHNRRKSLFKYVHINNKGQSSCTFDDTERVLISNRHLGVEPACDSIRSMMNKKEPIRFPYNCDKITVYGEPAGNGYKLYGYTYRDNLYRLDEEKIVIY